MAEANDVQVVIVGSIGLDTIETPFEKRESLLGGSVSYACAAASFFTTVGMVGVVGSDFDDDHMAAYRQFGIDLEGLQQVEGKTFRWSGVYDADMINRQTLSTDLNVFEHFMPDMPESYRDADYVLLGNIAPELQLHVLDQVQSPEFIVADTMDLWINIAHEKLLEVIGRVDMLMLNDSEARLLTDQYHLRACADTIRAMGPTYVVIKKGEHGAMLFGPDGLFIVPAYPVETVTDPTGAGDTFAGAMIGHLAQNGGVSDEALRAALLHGAVVASHGVEAFSLDRLLKLQPEDISTRASELKSMVAI
ncbi:MAG: PfkB family carbohydrate kinase [Kiritimatiellia bacterium]|jgi:sugar/nucleoside kinase (ribokinase family)|nr:PfkB family carbohydrate kinase [Kiritimatiellia bacterium]MDP6809201.1 PfkB family carbohydrate kinase [Kiritimatiellia bacterium]MDP7022940.1 PfkB family carbohydrate kinase [Kiritimatiellia bacterium]